MGKIKKHIKAVILIFLLLFTFYNSEAEDTIKIEKKRLPVSINRIQPVLVPVLTLDGEQLYFDRKQHPFNTGGINDNDDIWYVNRMGNDWSRPKKLKKPLNSDSTDVLFTITPDGTTALVYSARNKEDLQGTGFYLWFRTEDSWTIGPKLFINDFYNNSPYIYAYLTHDLQHIFMSLVRDDSEGKHDLYISSYDKESKSWSAPKSLGNKINTSGIETSPFLAYDGVTLYFSSDKKGGEGGNDLYMSKALDNSYTNWSEPIHLGTDINTYVDEKSISLNALSDKAFIVSWDSSASREGIYETTLPDSCQSDSYIIVKGKVFRNIQGEKILHRRAVEISTKDRFGNEVKTISNPLNSEFLLIVNDTSKTLTLNAFDLENEFKTSFNLTPYRKKTPSFAEIDIEFPLEKRDLLINKELEYYFDYNSSSLDDIVKTDIKGYIDVLKNPKEIDVSIVGYADTTGTVDYNNILSLKRAKTIEDFLASIGLDRNKIKIRAKGENIKYESDEKNRRVDILFRTNRKNIKLD